MADREHRDVSGRALPLADHAPPKAGRVPRHHLARRPGRRYGDGRCRGGSPHPSLLFDYLADTNPSTLEVFTGFDNSNLGFTTGYDPAVVAKVSHLPYVRGYATVVGFNGNLDTNVLKGIHPHELVAEKPPVFEGSLGTEYETRDRATVVQGAMGNPNDAHEAVMNAQAARELGVHVGSVIQVGFYSDAQQLLPDVGEPSVKPYLAPRFKVVGIVVLAGDVVADQIDALGSATVLFSPALTRELASCCAYYSYTALDLVGGTRHLAGVEAGVSRLLPQLYAGTGARTYAGIEATADRAIKPEAIALGAFGGLAAVALLLIASQVIGRHLRLEAGDSATLRALGADPAMTVADGVVGIAGAVIVGSLLAVLVAVALSPLAPFGPVRPVYPSLGVAFDWTGLGVVAMVVVLVGLTVVLAAVRAPHRGTRRRQVVERPSTVAHAAAATGLPTTAVTGIRFALETRCREQRRAGALGHLGCSARDDRRDGDDHVRVQPGQPRSSSAALRVELELRAALGLCRR